MHKPRVPQQHGREIYMIFVIYTLRSIKNIYIYKDVLGIDGLNISEWFWKRIQPHFAQQALDDELRDKLIFPRNDYTSTLEQNR